MTAQSKAREEGKEKRRVVPPAHYSPHSMKEERNKIETIKKKN